MAFIPGCLRRRWVLSCLMPSAENPHTEQSDFRSFSMIDFRSLSFTNFRSFSMLKFLPLPLSDLGSWSLVASIDILFTSLLFILRQETSFFHLKNIKNNSFHLKFLNQSIVDVPQIFCWNFIYVFFCFDISLFLSFLDYWLLRLSNSLDSILLVKVNSLTWLWKINIK